jgi:molecular chaperone DnaJ
MPKRDYYEVLGVAKTADEAALKSAFRKLAMQYHPDRNPGDAKAEAAFKEVNEAYQVLSDAQKRAAYDRLGHRAFEQGGGGFDPGFGSSMSDIFEEFFGDMMGRQRGGRGGPERGADLRYNMEISLEEAFVGKVAQIRVPTSLACEVCSGTGAKPGTKPKTCGTCKGSGRIRQAQGFFTLERTCPTCQGRGEVIEDPCSACSGTGRVTRERTLSVNIPAGVEDGTRIRLSGEGEAGGKGGPSGDLYIFLSIRPHEFYQREGADLFCRIPIPLTIAALGGNYDVPTLDGERSRLKVPESTQSGKQFRLRGKGMPVLRSKEVGDLYVQTVVETPSNLTKRQRELLEEFAKTENREQPTESAGFFKRVRSFFDGIGPDAR